MTVNSVSSYYLGNAMLPGIHQTQTQLAKLSIEASTGEYADLGLQLGSQSGFELSLRNDDDLLQSLTSANAITSTHLSTAQTVLSSITASAQKAASDLLPLVNSSTQGATLQTVGQANLQQLTAAANTTSGTVFVFGGDNARVAPLNDFYASPTSNAKTSVDNAFQTYFGFSIGSPLASTITDTQMQSFLTGPYAALFSNASWTSDWSNASNQNMSAEIAPGQTVTTSANVNTTGIQQLAQAYTMLSEFGNSGLSANAQSTMVTAAISLINYGVANISATQAQLGASQNAITDANSYMSAQMSQVQTELGKLDTVDGASVATQLSTLSTQLQSAYQLTAQIQKLSLAQYLPA